MPLSAEHALDGVNEEEAICGGLITKVIRKNGSAGQNLSGRARAEAFIDGGRAAAAHCSFLRDFPDRRGRTPVKASS